jgi:hypothetical protein
LGKVSAEVSAEEGYQAARRVALAHLGSLKRVLVDLDRISAWLRVFAVVNVAPEFNQTTLWSRSRGARPLLHRDDDPAQRPDNCEAEVEIDG